ncbi:MAG: phage tail tape measure protein [Clostridium sp.]|nr:phage tail tape measure protein [Clostridium sp.]
MAVEETLAKLGIQIAFDSSGLKEGITKVNNNLKTLKSELNLSRSTMSNFGDTTESLKTKANNLSQVITNQKAKVELLRKQYEASAQAKGEDATQTQKLKVQLNNATATLNDMERELENLNSDIKGHVAEWKKLGTTLTDISGKIKTVGSTLSSIGSTLTRYVTAPIVGVGTYSAKAATDFESAFAGVRKTVDATEEEFAKLEEGIRKMSTEMPASASEIAAVAEAARTIRY